MMQPMTATPVMTHFQTMPATHTTTGLRTTPWARLGGTESTSAPERAFVEQLRVWFGAVESHRYVDGFWTDAYIPCINTYVQFDGEYYHGLDRPFDQLNESQRAKFDRDRRADAHFLERGLKLIRVTDREYRELPLDEIRRRF
jgi:hypothetical protein